MEKNRRKILRITLEFAFSISLIVFFVLLNEQMKQNKEYKFVAENDSYKYVYQIDSVAQDDSKLEINGWFVELKKVRNEEVEIHNHKDLRIILYDLSSTIERNIDNSEKMRDGIAMKVKFSKREDVNDLLDCEYDYSDCGFTAQVDISRVELNDKVYQVVFKLDENAEYGILANAYIKNGELYYNNPVDAEPLEVVNTYLESIVKHGVCLFSSMNYHICIYQYDGSLYWIADPLYVFGENNKTLIQCQIDTTRFDKLSQQRIDGGWYWTNTSFYFEEHEITNSENCGKYRVAVREIPNSYPVTGISTGCSVSGDKGWNAFIRPIRKKV